MKSISIYIFLIIVTALKVNAQQASQQIADDEERQQKWRTEMRNYKHEFMTKELDLKKEQQRRFFADYDEMEDRIAALNTNARDLEQRVLSSPDISDAELEAAAKTIYEVKKEESNIESEYFDKFKAVLNPKQLIRLKNTERKFTQQLVKQHRRIKSNDGGRRKQ